MSQVHVGKTTRSGQVPLVLLLALLALATLLACGGGGGGNGAGPNDESVADGNCADGIDNDADGLTDAANPGCTCGDADNDGVCDGADLCPGTDPACTVDADGCPLDFDGDTVCDSLDCADLFSGGQADFTACFEDSAIPNSCSGPFRLFVFVDSSGGALEVTVRTQDNPGGGSGQDADIDSAVCATNCSGDPPVFTCDVTDTEGNVRTITATLDSGDIEGTIETECGDLAAFRANSRNDTSCQ